MSVPRPLGVIECLECLLLSFSPFFPILSNSNFDYYPQYISIYVCICPLPSSPVFLFPLAAPSLGAVAHSQALESVSARARLLLRLQSANVLRRNDSVGKCATLLLFLYLFCFIIIILLLLNLNYCFHWEEEEE